MSKIVITWPESQMLFELKGFRENCSLINGEIGLEVYGSCAYLVDEDWYNNEEEPIDEDVEDDDFSEVELKHCYDDELFNLGFLDEDDFENDEDEL